MVLNRENFEKIYYSYASRLENFAGNFLPDRKMAVDLVHDSFIKLWDRYHDREMPSWAPLIFTIVRNSCLDYQRRAIVENKLFRNGLSETEDSEKLYALFMTDSLSDQRTIYRQLEDELRHIVDSLPARCREIFMMSRYECLNNKEIAIKEGISEQAVKNQVSKALKIIRHSLLGNGYIDSKLFSSIISLLLVS